MKESLQWWESKRKWYALIILVTVVSCEVINYINQRLIIEPDGLYSFSILGAIITVLVWTFGANLFYTLGFGIEAVFTHYLKREIPLLFRGFAFLAGLVFSILWTVINLVR